MRDHLRDNAMRSNQSKGDAFHVYPKRSGWILVWIALVIVILGLLVLL